VNNALAPIWRSFQAVAERVSMGANAIGTLCVLALVVIVNYDVVARGVFNNPFMGAVEVVQFSLVFIVFLQLPDVVRVGRLTRSDGFLVEDSGFFWRAGCVYRAVLADKAHHLFECSSMRAVVCGQGHWQSSRRPC